MIAQYDNIVAESFLMFLDHELLKKGEAYANQGISFYKVPTNYANYSIYAAAYQPLVSDASITGAVIPTGIYLNNVAINTGQSGFLGINYAKGQVIFSGNTNYTNITGRFAIKDIAVKLTSESEENLLFERSYRLRSKVGAPVTGILDHEYTYPVMWVKNNGGNNDPFAFGGLDKTNYNFRCIGIFSSQFMLDAANSIMRDIARKPVPLIRHAEYPFNALGFYKSGQYNYDNIVSGKGVELFIDDSAVLRYDISLKVTAEQLNTDVFLGIYEIDMSSIRSPRV